MKLNVGERLHVMRLLPEENNYTTLKAIRKAREILGINDEEYKECGFIEKTTTDEKGRKLSFTEWNKKGLEEKEIEIGEVAENLIIEELKKLDRDKRLPEKLFSLYEKFVVEKREGE